MFYMLLFCAFFLFLCYHMSGGISSLVVGFFSYVQKHKKYIHESINYLTGKLGIEMISVPEAVIIGTHLAITYVFRGKTYVERLPYNARNGRSGKKFMGCVDGKTIDLQHHPGLEFLMRADELGYDEIRVFELNDQLIC